MKKILALCLVFIFGFSSFAYAKEKPIRITDAELKIIKGKVYFEATVSAPFTTGLSGLIKVMNLNEELIYFDEIKESGGKIKASFRPKDTAKNQKMLLKISGDFIYSTEFFYDKEGIRGSMEKGEMSVFKELSSFLTYEDVAGNIPFEVRVKGKKDGYNIFLTANLPRTSDVFKNKEESRFHNYLKMLLHKAFLKTGKNISLFVYDKNKNFITKIEAYEKEETSKPSLKKLLTEVNLKHNQIQNFTIKYQLEPDKIGTRLKIKGVFIRANKKDPKFNSLPVEEMSTYINEVGELLLEGKESFVLLLYDKYGAFVNSYEFFTYSKTNFQYEYKPLHKVSGLMKLMSDYYKNHYFELGKEYIKEKDHQITLHFPELQIGKKAILIPLSNKNEEVLLSIGKKEVEKLKQASSILFIKDDFISFFIDSKDLSDHLSLNYAFHGNFNIGIKSSASLNVLIPYQKGSFKGKNLNYVNAKNVRTEELLYTKLDKKSLDFSFMHKEGESVYRLTNTEMSFPDIMSHWGREDILILSSKGIIKGLPDGNFYPNKEVTIAEFSVMLARVLGLNQSGNNWYEGSFYSLLGKGYLPSHITIKDATRPIKREEAFSILSTVYQKEFKASEKPAYLLYKDASSVSAYAKDGISVLSQAKIISGDNFNQVLPQKTLTRAEVSKILTKLILKI